MTESWNNFYPNLRVPKNHWSFHDKKRILEVSYIDIRTKWTYQIRHDLFQNIKRMREKDVDISKVHHKELD